MLAPIIQTSHYRMFRKRKKTSLNTTQQVK